MNRLLSILILALTVFTASAQTTVTWLTNATGLQSLPPVASRQVVAVGNESAGWSMWHWNAASTATTNETTVKYSGLTAGRWIQSPITGTGTSLTTTNGVSSGLTSSTLSSVAAGSVVTREYIDTPGATNLSDWMSIATWGDSHTHGYGGINETNSYPGKLATYSGFRVYNGGVGGETTTQILARFVARSNTWYQPTIIWAGHNDPNNATALTNIATMVSYLRAAGNSNRFLVLGLINGDTNTYWKGGAIYERYTNMNAQLSATYGDNYLDIRAYLVSRYDANDAQDVIDFGHDVPPSTLRIPNGDWFHLNEDGNDAVAQYLLTNSLARLRGSWSSVATPAAVANIMRAPGTIGIDGPTNAYFYDSHATYAYATSGINSYTGSANYHLLETPYDQYARLSNDKLGWAFSGDVSPITDGVSNLGNASGLFGWKDAYLRGVLYTPTITLTNSTGSKSATISSDATAWRLGAHFTPSTNAIGYLGTDSYHWAGAYIDTLLSGTVQATNVNASVITATSAAISADLTAQNLTASSTVSGGAVRSGTSYTTNTATAGGLLIYSGTNSVFAILNGNGTRWQLNGGINPYTDATYSLGEGSFRWLNGVFSGGLYSGSATVSGAVSAVSETVGSLVVTNNTQTGTLGINVASPLTQLNVKQTTSYNAPTLGTGTGSFFIGSSANSYGLYAGVSGGGPSWLQTMRNDTATAYDLWLNPSGGSVVIGSTSATSYKFFVGGTLGAQAVTATGALTAGSSGTVLTQLRHGVAVLVAGTKAVSDATVTANTRFTLTSNTDGGTPGWLRVSARSVGTSFTITSSSGTDTSTVAYWMWEP